MHQQERRATTERGYGKNSTTVCLMNSTVAVDSSVVRSIVENVTIHMQEEEKDSLLLTYTLLAILICLVLSWVISIQFQIEL